MATRPLAQPMFVDTPKVAQPPRTIADDSSPWLALTAPVALALTVLMVIYLSSMSF